MSIEREIASWDGKSAASIKSIYDEHKANEDFVDSIIALTSAEAYQSGSTWLLKAWLEDGNNLALSQTAKIYESLDLLTHWQARLHVLQCIPFMEINDSDCSKVYKFLKLTLVDPNKFVRAWSYNGFYELSKQHSEYLNETRQYFEMGMRDEALSVKARIQKILKKGF